MAVTRIIDDGLIRLAALNAGIADQFPFLRLPKAKASCCGKAERRQALNYNTVKSAIHGLSADQQRKLLAAMGLQRGRLIYNTGAGSVDVLIPSG